MSDLTDPNLIKQQYGDSQRLNARSALHARFSTNRYGWFRWIWDQLALRPHTRVLELGCGDGALWRDGAAAVPEDCHVTLTDISPGMVSQARVSLLSGDYDYGVVDLQNIPFPDATFDVIIANHVLYHVPERARALAEIARVLMPGGRLVASTIGRGHMGELMDCLRGIAPESIAPWGDPRNFHFTLQSAPDELASIFCEVACSLFPDHLAVTEVEPLMAYIASMATNAPLDPHLGALRALFEQELARAGVIRITKETGLVMAAKAAL